jgi:hypothetical protein
LLCCSSTPVSVAPASSSSSSAASAGGSSLTRLTGRSTRGRWGVDLLSDRPSIGLLTGSGVTSSDVIPAGYSNGHVAEGRELDERMKSADEKNKQHDLLYKSAMALATAPGKQLMMTAFMLWMSGNSLQIFSIMMLGMALWTPIGEIINLQTRFARYADSGVDLTLPKLTFLAMNLAGLAVGLYKCNSMGLLPTSSADWIDIGVRPAVQVAGGGIV